ncbi:MAG: DUF92 domain-containing protein [candidate division Zixibacteria bacterium]|nr:DUF92 domain-containing protein [candidate division Zixibacteria bacterium]
MILKLALQLFLGTVLSALVSTLAYRFKLLTSDGASAAFLLGAIIFGTGGIGFALPLLFFFFSSSFLSRYKSGQKIKYKDVFEKTGARDKNQVLANGVLAGALSFIYFIFPSPSIYSAYLACLATVNADTWGTEIGILSKAQPISLRGFKRVSPGSSGGISLIGTASSLFGSFFLVLVGFLPGISPVPFRTELFLIIVIAGFSGSFIDSLLGAFLQAQYLCPICNKSTERKTHCNFDTNRVSGISWLNNDWVNFLSSICGIILFFLLQKICGN